MSKITEQATIIGYDLCVNILRKLLHLLTKKKKKKNLDHIEETYPSRRPEAYCKIFERALRC